jgi:Gram-negative bacterial TonB protein C-terminal
MTNTTTPVESIGAPTGAASFYRWEVAGKPIAILFSLDLMDRLEREVLESFKAVTKRGSEIGGVLGGRVVAGSQPTVIVEQFEPVECDYSRGPLYLLSDEDKVRMKQALERVARAGGGVSVAGFFRSNTRRELVLDEEDQAVAKEFFSDPNNVFLLVRPFAMKPSAGAFFFWEGGHLPEESYQQFPFKRAELAKSFSQCIVAAPEAPVVREPLVMPRREERPVAPPVTMKREEPRPAPVAPPRREDPPPPPPPAMRREEPKREEPAPAPPPPVFKREEPKASVPPPVYKREEPKPAPPRREEAPPVNYRRDAPPVMRREERPPIVPVTPRREERPSGPTLVSRREEQAAPPAPPRREERPQPAPPVTAKRDERPPVVVKREEKPVAPPVVSRREEPAPPKPEEKPVVAKPAEAVVVAPPPKREEPVKVEQAKVEPPKAEPVKVEPVKVEPVKAAQPKVAPVVAAPVERIPVAAAETAEPGFVARFKWAIVAVLVVLLLGGGTFFYMRSSGTAAPAKTADTLLGLKVETNAGQLLLSWNRNATSVATATRATLTINDGDHKEDVDLDLATLHNGSIVYSPISNDVSFRLEVADQKTGKSEAGSVRRLAGRPSAAVAASVPQQMQQQPAKQTQAPNEQRPTQPAQVASAAPPPPAPVVSAGPAVTKEPVRENSLASRLRAAEPAEIPAAPALDSQPSQLAQNAPNVGGSVVAPPPPSPAQAQQRQTQATAAPPRASAPAPAPVTQTPSRIGGQAQEARVLKRFPAVYPLIARTSHIVGIVRVHAIIGKNGRVRKATATSGPQILRSAAVDSVMKWVYSPAILDGEPVEAETQVDVNFQM